MLLLLTRTLNWYTFWIGCPPRGSLTCRCFWALEPIGRVPAKFGGFGSKIFSGASWLLAFPIESRPFPSTLLAETLFVVRWLNEEDSLN